MDEMALRPNEENLRETVDALLARMRDMPERRKLRAWLFPTGMIVGWIVAMIALSAAGYLESAWPALVALVLAFGPACWIWFRAERREMHTIEALAACHDLRATGALLGFVNCSNRRIKNTVQTALLDLLPRITEEYSAWIGTGHREALNSLLYSKSGEMAMAALSALEQVGDGTALPYLTSIAAGKGIPDTLRHRRDEVQARAQYTVDRIRGRIEMQNRSSVLLRASQVPGTPSDQLVRPAHTPLLVDGRELLRAETSLEQDMEQPGLDQQDSGKRGVGDD